MKVNHDPNVVPLCDILLVLLIIFMVITPMAQVGIDIALPEMGQDGGGTPIVLNILEDGSFSINTEQVSSMTALEARLTDLFVSRSNKTIFVKGDSNITYKYMMDTMDCLKKSGLDKICVIPTPQASVRDSVPVYQRNRSRSL